MDAFDGKHGLFWHNYRSKTDRYVKVDYTHNPKSGNSWIYFTCSGYNSVRGCDSSRIKLKVKDVEQSVYTAMKAHGNESTY